MLKQVLSHIEKLKLSHTTCKGTRTVLCNNTTVTEMFKGQNHHYYF